MKHLALVLFTLCSASLAYSQSTNNAEIIKSKKKLLKVNTNYQKPSRDYVMLQVGFHDWILPDSSNITMRRRGHEINGYICYDFPLQKANFSFAAGLGLSSSNIYLDSMIMPLNRSGSAYNTVQFIADSVERFKRYKVSATYLEAPFELRYFANKLNRNRGFKVAIGAKVGTLINAHNKGVYANNAKVKEGNRRYHEQWRITPTLRVGWGNFSVFGSYQLSEVFKAGNVQGIRPYTIGICLSGM
jgi:hypothetical protein